MSRATRSLALALAGAGVVGCFVPQGCAGRRVYKLSGSAGARARFMAGVEDAGDSAEPREAKKHYGGRLPVSTSGEAMPVGWARRSLLRLLSESVPNGMTMADFRRVSSVRPGTLTGTLNSLAELGLIAIRSIGDARALGLHAGTKHIYLITGAGVDALKEDESS